MANETHISNLTSRLDVVAAWLYEHAPYADADQKHLDAGSPEQAYWHLGYTAALCDTIRLLEERCETLDNTDTSNPYFPNEPDA